MSNPVFQVDPAVLNGTPCFFGTRVPVQSLIHHLKLGYDVNEFLADYPAVQRGQVERLLSLIEHTLVMMAKESAIPPAEGNSG